MGSTYQEKQVPQSTSMPSTKSQSSNQESGTPKSSIAKINGFIKKSRRSSSVGRAQDIQEKEKKQRAGQPDQPVHEPKDSLFCSSSGWTNYRGLLNLCIVLLVLSNTRVALENIIKYGILVDPVQWFRVMSNPTILPSVQIVFGLNVFLLISYWIEKYGLATGVINEIGSRFLIIINIASIIIVPAYVVYTTDVHPVGSSMALGLASIVALKLISYHMVNYWCRCDIQKKTYCHHAGGNYHQKLRRYRSLSHNPSTIFNSEIRNGNVKKQKFENDITQSLVIYPDNLNYRDIYYFMFAPTLCYELNFPRSQRIRKRFLLKRGAEMVLLLQLMLGLIQQWLVPTINNSLQPLQEMNYPKMSERLLKLAVPNHLIWLIFFYWGFHSTLNFVGELVTFADREFYRDWWNSETVPYFWSNWNIPVHKWCLRHLYKPLLKRGWGQCQASTAVFFVSAFFHEYLISVPLKMFKVWAFTAMLSQIPFAMLVSRYLGNHPHYANIAVWISLIIGQPLCILMYYHDYYVINQVST